MSTKGSGDDISLTADNEMLGSPRREAQPVMEAAIKAILEGGLAAQIKTVVQQQAALVFGELSDIRDSTPSTDRGSRATAMEVEHDVRRSRQALLVGGEVIERFNPDDKDSNVNRWLNTIDQLGDVHDWAEYDRSTIMQSKLCGSARRWYHQLERYDYSWARWKAMLREAFPRRYDYAVMLEELVARRKATGESMTTYYHAKLALCNRVGVRGEHAVSCIIRGLPDELRANAYAAGFTTPEALYNQFLAGLESYSTGTDKRGEHGESSRATKRGVATSGGGLVRCYNCQEQGTHYSRDCPKERKDRCRICGEGGHLAKACSKRRSEQAASDNQVSLIIKPNNSVFRQWAYIKGEAVRAYVDTGSEPNLMAAETARRLRLAVNPDGQGVRLNGFGGGVAQSLGVVEFELVMADLELATRAMVTDCDMGRVELLIGQEAIQAPGVTLVVRNNKVALVKEADVGEFFRRLSVEEDPSRCRVLLDEDVDIEAGASKMAMVHLDGGGHGETVYMVAKRFSDGKVAVAIPSAVLVCGEPNRILITNLGEVDLQWRKGRLISRADPCQADTRREDQPEVNVLTISQGACLDLSELKVGDVSDECKRRLGELLQAKMSCFAHGDGDVGLTNLGEMQIRLTTDVPVYYRPYRLSLAERRVVQEKVQTLLAAGVIRESESAYASPIVLIPKKTGEVRLCVDYRALNAITVKDRFPLPLIADQLDKLANKKYFTTLDLAQGYHQVAMHPDSVDKTAFITPDGHYEFLRVPFGLANSPAVFQRIINKMLGALRFDQVLAYMDDLLIPSCTAEQGLELLEIVLALVEKAGVKLKLQKCSFLMHEVEYLGHEISGEGIQPGRRKTKAVVDFPVPTDVHGVRQFIGLASYFRKFVQNFSVVARPLTDLTKKDVPWHWGGDQQSAFEQLKSCLASRPLLALYDSKANTELHTDASKWGIGGILLQQTGEQQSWRPVEYFSRATTASEQVWHSYELETMAVVESIKRFRVYLLGIQFKVVTDCVAVRATLIKRDLVPRIARWWLAIQEYDFVIDYRPGGRMLHVDALSRNPSGEGGSAECMDVCVVSVAEDDWFLTVQLQDPKAQQLVKVLTSGEADRDIKATFKVKRGRLYRITLNGDRLYVPAMARFSVVRKHHDDVGHPGYERCLGLIKETYWFPRMSRFVMKYVRSCMRCAFAKGNYGRGEGFLHPIERRPIPFDTVHIDHLGPFVRSVGGHSYLLVIMDGFTKFVLAKPTRTLRSTEAITKLREVFSEFGYPRRIVSDRGLAFTSRRFQEFMAEKGVRHVQNSIATPRANGQVERANRTIIQALAASADTECRWDERVPDIVWGLNNTVNASTRFSPAQLMFSHANGVVADLAIGELASEGGTGVGSSSQVAQAAEAQCAGGSVQTYEHGGAHASLQGDDLVDIAAEMRAQLQAKRERAGGNIAKTARRMKARFDRRRKVPTKYKVGDLVLWRQAATNKASAGVNQKIANKFDGPFQVKKALGGDRYLIEAIKGVRGYKRFAATVAVDSLRRYHSVNQGEGDDIGDGDSSSEVDRADLIDLLEG